MEQLKRFNYAAIYKSTKLKNNHERIARGFRILFDKFYEDIKENNKKSIIIRDFLNTKTAEYLNNTPTALLVRDYIAGMTDRYFVDILKRIVVPDITLGEV